MTLLRVPSISSILGVLFLAYICHSMYLMAQLFAHLNCSDAPCYTYFLDDSPAMQLAIFTSVNGKPLHSEVSKVHGNEQLNYLQPLKLPLDLELPLKTRRNGTLFLHVVFAEKGAAIEWKTLKRNGPTVVQTFLITDYLLPQADYYNLLTENQAANNKKSQQQKENALKPSTHIMSSVHMLLLTDSISLSRQDVPAELAPLLHINAQQQILPILKMDSFNTLLKDMRAVNRDTLNFTVEFNLKPTGIGKLRLMLLVEHAMKSMQQLGFSKKDVDEVKGLFSDANLYLLLTTFFVAAVHLIFDFLSIKNDVSFWRKKQSYEGLSRRTIMWRAFSQIIIFLYLLDDHTSLLVLLPAGVGVLIELWKCKKILKLQISWRGIKKQCPTTAAATTTAVRAIEQATEQFDKQGMLYLSYLLYPLCLAGAAYSLIYKPHKSWYSWSINSLVNGVYAFGFLFMLPQLFVNYKLKSVAALPWRSFMYKAFNTFIDDFFAFVITMPTAHRVACLRDDVVFLIYLYQRWLYPVDKSRMDTGIAIEEQIETTDEIAKEQQAEQQPDNEKVEEIIETKKQK